MGKYKIQRLEAPKENGRGTLIVKPND